MKQILSRCGFRCDLCLAYKPNIERIPENRQKLSDGWFKYFGFRIPPEKIFCNGCISENSATIDSSCAVRPCVNEKGLENCAYCGEYICDKLQQRIVTYEGIASKVGHTTITEDDYRCFIEPYENKKHLDELRKKGE